jgi:DNA repair protein RecO (recombination protein O)
VALEKAEGLVVRGTDWSETSRIVTLWTREFGRVRLLAKGGRRLKSSFESALDLLSVYSIVLLRKSSGGLDLLTEARVVRGFPRLRQDLQALYAAYYMAELLSDWTEDYDPHPVLYDETLATLAELGGTDQGIRLARYECVLFAELGYSPSLEACSNCGASPSENELIFSALAGGILCPGCARSQPDRRPLSVEAWQALRELSVSGEAWRQPRSSAVRTELRRVLSHYVTTLLGRRPRLLPYLGS